MNDFKKNDSNKEIGTDSMDRECGDDGLLHLVKSLQTRVKALEQQLQSFREGITPLEEALQSLYPTAAHLRVAEGRNFNKAMAIIAADLLVGRIQLANSDILVGGYPLGARDLRMVFRELQRALQRRIVVETKQRREVLIAASSCMLSTRLLKNVSECTYRSVPKMLQFKKHLMHAIAHRDMCSDYLPNP